jgi:septal ring factor EnvC (AmiA/AmiB activator)
VAQGKLKSNGIRIATKEDGFVKSVHDGRVIFSDWLRGFGLLLIIDHGDDYMSLYGNNKTLLKETGDWITGGEVIAHTRSSGSSKESGLYFEIRYKGKPKNPLKWLKR